MPYFIYRINSGPGSLAKNLEKLEEYPTFKEAKLRARSMRSARSETDNYDIKVMFANNEQEAEENLKEKRQAPILREWEK